MENGTRASQPGEAALLRETRIIERALELVRADASAPHRASSMQRQLRALKDELQHLATGVYGAADCREQVERMIHVAQFEQAGVRR